MTEFEKIKQAKTYMDKLANGVDPISEREIPEDSTLNNIHLSRCFFFISDTLRQLIERNETIKHRCRSSLLDFQLSSDKAALYPFSNRPICISEIIASINGLINTEVMRKIRSTTITDWLLGKGFLELCEYPTGKKTRQPTKQGEFIGLSTELRTGQRGEFNIVVYDEAAQHFVIDNLDVMVDFYKNKKF